MGLRSHMPFYVKNLQGQSLLFWCEPAIENARSALWKYKYKNLEDGKELEFRTGLPDSYCECSLSGWEDETGWHLSVIGGGGENGNPYHLYRIDGMSLDTLNPPVAIKQTRTGFIYKDRLVFGDKDSRVYVIDPHQEQAIELPGMDILRVGYRSDQPDILLISCKWLLEDAICTVMYNLKTGEQYFVEVDGEPAYKPSILDTEIYYAQRISSGFEDRQIRYSEAISYTPCKLASVKSTYSIPPQESIIDVANRARASEPLSIEKHLSAAFVLSSELMHGYSYRMRFVGHLHEAEDESQEYPDLHLAIRTARKQFQINGTIPDWDYISNLLYTSVIKQ